MIRLSLNYIVYEREVSVMSRASSLKAEKGYSILSRTSRSSVYHKLFKKIASRQ